MIEIISNSANEVTFGELKSGDVFVQGGVAYIKVEPNHLVNLLTEHLEYDTLDSIEELPCLPNNAIMLRSGVNMFFDETDTIIPVKKATLTLDY
jgi:hypothetical protein